MNTFGDFIKVMSIGCGAIGLIVSLVGISYFSWAWWTFIPITYLSALIFPWLILSLISVVGMLVVKLFPQLAAKK